MSETRCPIWGTPAKMNSSSGDGRTVDSARAGGQYFVSGTAEPSLQQLNVRDKVLITTWLVEQRRLGEPCPKISSGTLKEVSQTRLPSVLDRADALLRYIGVNSDLLGTIITFRTAKHARNIETTYGLLAWTASQYLSEVITLSEYCDQEGWIEHRVPDMLMGSQDEIHELMLRPPGYSRLAELDRVTSGSKKAFVAMWFDPSMEDAYQDAGYEAIRIDRKDHNNKIDDEIVSEIRRSRFVVADFTQGDSGARGGVYYEAGFANGLNIPVIFTCRKDAIKHVHFDTRQYNHIIWTDPEELKGLLTKRISATLGDGPLKATV